MAIPDSVESIGSFAFEHCSALQSVTIPDSVTRIGDHAFRGCSSIKILVLIIVSIYTYVKRVKR